jgi:LacI family transcriptional regulator
VANAKYMRIAEQLGQRIRRGDYHLNTLPSERRLASEVGVSMMTARKAVKKLLDDGLLHRSTNGRLQIKPDTQRTTGTHQLAMLVPAFDSAEVQSWQNVIVRTAPDHRCTVRIVNYAHWDDPTLMRTLTSFSGTFFLPLGERPPERVMNRIRDLNKPLVVINQDWSEYSIPSLRRYPLSSVRIVLDHLYDIGRRKIACINVQPEDSIVLGRIQQWRTWMVQRKLDGTLLHEPVKPFTSPLPAAHQVAREFLAQNRDNCDGLFCVTEAAAISAIRAMADLDIRAGQEISVCTVDSHTGQFVVPSITSLTRPDVEALVAGCMRWMAGPPGEPWIGPLLIEPTDITLAARESTLQS